MAERKAWWEILRDQFASRGLLDPESERLQEAAQAAPAVQRQARGLLSLDPQAESDTALEIGLGSLPGVGQAMALRDLERARRAKDPGAAAMAASNFIPFGTLLNRFRRGPMSELDVYHGTPHQFPATEVNPLGEFDASKIGTGEGAQAYGHGIYLAESPGVARSYIKTPDDWAAQADVKNSSYRKAQSEIIRTGRELRKQFPTLIPKDEISPFMYVESNKSMFPKETIEKVENIRKAEEKAYKSFSSGSFYKADLPDEMIDRMLDWDKPLSEQSEAVRRVLMPMVMAKMKERGTPPHALEYSANRALGGDIVKNLFVGNGVTSKDVSRMLQEAGIPGVRYFDAGSRGGDSATGTRNFVVFPGEEKKVKILERK